MPRQGKRRAIATNIYADRAGLEAVARATVDGVPLTRSKRYPRETPVKEIRSWQRDTERELRKLEGAIAKGTLADDVEVYLSRVRETLASFSDRERDVRTWLAKFGHRRRHSLRTAELDAQLRAWRSVDQLSASTVNHRRDALSDLFQVLGGPAAANPVKGCVWFARTKAAPKGIDRARIWRVLQAMDPDRKTRWRLSLMHWTGMRPSQMGRLEGPDDFFIDARAFELEVQGTVRRVPAVLVPFGKGGERVMVPLTAEGEEVARQFIRTDAFWRPSKAKDPAKRARQTWSCPSAYKRIVAAAKKISERPFTVYTIKHSFASSLLQTGADIKIIQELLGHADLKSTSVYAHGVSATHVQALDRLRADDARRYDRPSSREADSTENVALSRGTDRQRIA